MAKRALFYEKTGDKVKCLLCPHGCVLRPGQTGLCLARKNEGGELYSLNYGKASALALDPIEKKPLKKFYPGSMILSTGSFGCNLKCAFCQNWHISQHEPDCYEATPQRLAQLAQDYQEKGNIGLAYTYNEPSIWYEFVLECAKAVKVTGMKNVLVTNGYINKEPMEQLLPYIDAMNIDLKAMTESFYKEVCKGELSFVQDTIALCAKACHVEVTTLIIPGKNDSKEEIGALSQWIASVSPDIPLHLSAYHPDYRMSEPKSTTREELYELADIAGRNLHNVYCGNI